MMNLMEADAAPAATSAKSLIAVWARRLANLEQGRAMCSSDTSDATLDDLAKSYGLNRNLVYYARRLYEEVASDVRLRFEPEIVGGTKSLLQVLIEHGLDRDQQASLSRRAARSFSQACLQLREALPLWNTMDEQTREQLTENLRDVLRSGPLDL